jgi:hypothetical protein
MEPCDELRQLRERIARLEVQARLKAAAQKGIQPGSVVVQHWRENGNGRSTYYVVIGTMSDGSLRCLKLAAEQPVDPTSANVSAVSHKIGRPGSAEPVQELVRLLDRRIMPLFSDE